MSDAKVTREREYWQGLVERVRQHPNDVIDIVLECERVAKMAERSAVVAWLDGVCEAAEIERGEHVKGDGEGG